MPRLDTIVELASGLEVEPAELFEGMSWRMAPGNPDAFASLRSKPYDRR
jgi:hypothetical protein